MTPALKVDRAISGLVLTYRFYADLLLNLPVRASESIPTAGVNGVELLYNSSFIDSLPLDQVKGLLIHEIEHIIRFHCFRGLYFADAERYNIAADMRINSDLAQCKDITLPPNGHYCPDAWIDKTEEEIYHLLPEHQGEGWGRDLMPPSKDGEPMTPGQIQEAQEGLKRKIESAAERARQQGNLPAHLSRILASIRRQPVADLHRALRRFVSSALRSGSDWQRPHRRYIPLGIYAPAPRIVHTPPAVMMAIDTSGSMDQDSLDYAWGVVLSVAEDIRPKRIHLYLCDAEVHDKLTLSPFSLPRQIKTKGGGGGTSFIPVFEEAKRDKLNICCGIYITDGYGEFPSRPPYPTFWICTTNIVAPYGTTYHVKAAQDG